MLDNVRHGLCKDPGFNDIGRVGNIHRVGEVSKLMLDAGSIVLAAFISPFKQQDRQMVRQLVDDEFIHVNTSLTIS